MKRLFKVIIVASAIAFSSAVYANAQESSTDECMLYLSYYQEYYKQNTTESRKAALPSWRKAYNICAPATRQNLYVHGSALYRMLIKENAKNPEYRKALIDTLITLDKLRIQYYPKYAKSAYSALSGDINNYLVKVDPAKARELLKEIVEVQGAEAQPVTFLALMNTSVALYKQNKITAEDVIADYDKSADCFTQLQKVDTTQNTRNLRTTFENVFINSKVASCENLIQLFGPRFEESKDDYATVSKIAKLMATSENCTDNELYLKAVTAMHSLQPNASSAYYLYRLNVAKDDNQLAAKYLEEACASADIDEPTRGQYLYELGAFYLMNGHHAKAVDNASKAITCDATLAGKCYMIIGHAWMSIGCGGNEVERRAKYWVAVDYFNKAKAADDTLAEDASKQISSCAAFYPQTAEAFMYDLQNGASYTASCGGLRANTTVRTR